MTELVPLVAAIPASLKAALVAPGLWGMLAGMIGLWLLVPRSTPRGRAIGRLLIAIAGGALAASLPGLGDVGAGCLFWLLTFVTLGAAVATISQRSPVYAAIWFAISLLGTAGLFLFQGAQFLGVATIVVYAGAIVVTFLFVVMLAQPEGDASYDRISWSGFVKPLAVVAATALVAITSFSAARAFPGTHADASVTAPSVIPASVSGSRPSGANSTAESSDARDVLQKQHVARLGGELFSRHLVSVEVAGMLLLVALVGAVAIVSQERAPQEGKNHG